MVLYSRNRLITNQSVFPEALLRCSAEHASVGDSREEPLPPPLPWRLLSSLGQKWVCKEKLEGMGETRVGTGEGSVCGHGKPNRGMKQLLTQMGGPGALPASTGATGQALRVPVFCRSSWLCTHPVSL